MTISEARKNAEEVLSNIVAVMKLTEDKPIKLFYELDKLLAECSASYRGETEPDQPLGIPWSLHDMTLIETLRKHWLPGVLGATEHVNKQQE